MSYNIVFLYQQQHKLIMGNILKLKASSKVTKKTHASSNSKKVNHRARVLTSSDVQANRSMAYTYLNI